MHLESIVGVAGPNIPTQLRRARKPQVFLESRKKVIAITCRMVTAVDPLRKVVIPVSNGLHPRAKKAAGNTKVTNKDSELHHQYKEARDAVLATLADRAKTRVPTSQTRLGESLSLPKFADRKNGSNVPLMTDEWVWNEHVLAHLISEAQAEWAKFDTLEAQFKAHYRGTSAEQRAMNVDRGIRKQYENYVTCNDCAIPDKRARQYLMQQLYAKQYGKEEIGGQLLQVMEDLVEIDSWMKRFEKDKQRMAKNDDAIPNHAVARYKKLLRLAGAKCNHQHEKLKSQAKAKKGAKLEDSGPSDIEMDVLGNLQDLFS